MPARLSSMELSDPGSSHAINRRKSGCAVKKPEFFQEDASTHSNHSGKRKRVDRAEVEDEDMVDDASMEDSVDESDGQADEEELKEKRRKAPKVKTVQSKPAAKKPKTVNGMGKLAIRPAPNGAKKAAARPKKQPCARQSALQDADGLYGMSIKPGTWKVLLRIHTQLRSSLVGTRRMRLLRNGSQNSNRTTRMPCATWSILS